MKKLIPAAGCAVAAMGMALFATTAHAGPESWTPTASQLSAALGQAQLEAWTTSAGVTPGTVPNSVRATTVGSPAPSGAQDLTSATAWPGTVQSVTYLALPRAAAAKWIDGSPVPDNRDVVVVRLIGQFTVNVSGPRGSAPTVSGQTMTFTVDASNGQVLDFGLEPAPALPQLPNSHAVFRR